MLYQLLGNKVNFEASPLCSLTRCFAKMKKVTFQLKFESVIANALNIDG